jgi:hypothetical protein
MADSAAVEASINKTVFASGVFAAVLTIIVTLIQIDKVARFILSPARLKAKRRQEQKYELEKAISTSILHTRKYVNEGSFYDWQEEKKITQLIASDEGVKSFVDEIVLDSLSLGDKNSNNDNEEQEVRYFKDTPLIVGISKDMTLPKASEWYIYLAFPFTIGDEDSEEIEKTHYGRRVQLPLEKFGTFLAKKFESQSQENKRNLCFVADASSSLGSHVVGQIIQHCQCEIPVIHEPAWMFTLAFLVQVKAMDIDALEKVLFALCKLSVQSIGGKVGERFNTVAFTLPGQSSVPTVLPLLQKIFPHERFIFSYNQCFESIQLALNLSATELINKGVENSIYSIPEISMSRSVTSSIPLTPLSMKEFVSQSSSMSQKVASIFTSWMGSMKTMDRLKRKEGIFRFHVGEITSINASTPESDVASKVQLHALLKFVTGSAADSELDFNIEDAACSIMMDLALIIDDDAKFTTSISPKEEKAIETCRSMIMV